MATIRISALFIALPILVHAQFNTHLSPATDRAFEDYRKNAEAALDTRPHYGNEIKPRQVTITPINGKGNIDVKDGIVHDWLAAAFVPNKTPAQVLAVLQNYEQYKNLYRPEVVESKVISHNGDLWHIYLQVTKKKVLTVLLNSEFDVDYHPLGQDRWTVTSRSTRIAEMEDKRELEPGEGHGFMWRLNAYWLIEPRPGGVYFECRAISLSRDIPAGLGWIVKPFVSSVPKESLKDTMESTLKALS